MIWLLKQRTFQIARDVSNPTASLSLSASCSKSDKDGPTIAHFDTFTVLVALPRTNPAFSSPGMEFASSPVGPTTRHACKLTEAEMQIGVETSKAVDQRRVFVIDEDEITRAALQFMLHDEIETHELTSPEEAYEKGIGWLQPHVVLLGVSFLRQRGSALIGELTAKFPGVRVLIVCAKSDEAVAIEGLKAGAHGAMVKPLTLEAVRKKVDTILGRGGASPLVQLSVL
jgi:CheY-like chemotaxis protein